MSENRRIPGGSSEALALFEWNVCALFVSVELCQSEINQINVVLALPDSNQKVVGLNVTVYEASLVHVLDP